MRMKKRTAKILALFTLAAAATLVATGLCAQKAVVTADEATTSTTETLISPLSYEEYLSKDVCYKLPIRANIYLSMTALLRHYCGKKDDSERLEYHNVLRLRPVINYIAEHYTEKIYIEDLCSIIMVSPDYFTKMFRDSIGKTPIGYINGIKVNHSMKLLIGTDKTIAEIADEIGFYNANYFHKIFKQYMGVSPLAYRKANKA